jgi:thiol-disulfide isomerase/thioredoxin
MLRGTRRVSMRASGRALRVLFVAAAIVPLGAIRAADDPPPIVREYKGRLDPIGPFDWVDLNGKHWTERDFRGKVLIVQSWATFCGPCIREFPEVQKLYEAVRRDPTLAFVSLDMDPDPGAIGDFLKAFRKKYSFPVLFAGAHLKVSSLPHTWIVDREGYIRDGFGNAGTDLVGEALALAQAVKRRLPVSALPPEALQAARKQNQLEGENLP